jgi:predicted DNA-binding helix-hairpin-helix protein
MEALKGLQTLSAFMDTEVSDDKEQTCQVRNIDEVFISRAVSGNGKTINLVKTLLTSACERNCYYCACRAGRDFNRATFKPEELARTFISIYHAGVADGILLSSGIAGGGIKIQDLLIKTAEILRFRLGYQGYLHLKIMPGAEYAQVERSMQLADRVPVNLEAPNPNRLIILAPRKDYFEELIRPLEWINRIRRSIPPIQAWKSHWPSSVT